MGRDGGCRYAAFGDGSSSGDSGTRHAQTVRLFGEGSIVWRAYVVDLDHIRREPVARPGDGYRDRTARSAAVAVVLHEGARGVVALFI